MLPLPVAHEAATLAACHASGYVELMRGYFLHRSGRHQQAHESGQSDPLGASLVFLIGVHYTAGSVLSDTSQAERQMPLYRFEAVEQLVLPKGCGLIGVEPIDEATLLPGFRHPLNAAYVFGPERSALSPAMVARGDHVVPRRARCAPAARPSPCAFHVYGNPISRRRPRISGQPGISRSWR
jgi:hypothetical protein